MVLTRSKGPAVPVVAPKKIKFLDEDFQTADEKEEVEEVEEEEEEDSDDEDSDDEAPEEETTSGAKAAILQRQKEQKQIEEERKRQEKEKRRKQDQLHREQQQKKKESTKIQEDLPEFLPEDIFDDIEEEEEEQEQEIAAAKGKHLKLQDFEEFDKRALAKQIKEEKLKQLKLRKKLIVKRGPVHVKVTSISSQQVNKKLVPVAENKIVNSRNKWLKRKSLGKK